MLRRGIFTEDEYIRAGPGRQFSGARVSYTLLDVGENATEEQIRVFEDVSFTLRISNGTFRTTFRQRFRDVDAAALRWMEQLFPDGAELRVQDRAVSSGLTSWEWAEQLFPVFPQAQFEASDILLHLVQVSLPDGATYIAEPDGRPLQYSKPPFVVSLQHPESLRYPLNRAVAFRAKRRFERLRLPEGWTDSSGGAGYLVSRISCIHPRALAFARTNPGFQFRARSVFDSAPGTCHVLRTMNIFNKSYFSAEQLKEGVNAVFRSLVPGGLWIVGRTLEEDFSNHATFLSKRESGWEVLERIGAGSEMEEVALA
jgi:hypothetical protein